MRSERITPLTEVERDALCELANVAMSRAATNLGQMVGRPILLSVPTCEILAPEMAVETLTKPGNPNLVAVRQDFTGAFSGRALLIFPERGSLELMRAILGRQLAAHDILDLEDETLTETGNVILNSWLATLANILKKSLKMSLPVVIRRNQQHIFETAGSRESCILFVHVKFEVSDLEVRGDVVLMMDLPSIEQLRSLVATFVESLNS